MRDFPLVLRLPKRTPDPAPNSTVHHHSSFRARSSANLANSRGAPSRHWP